MGNHLLALTGLCYVYVAGEYLFRHKDLGMALAFAAYAAANAGFIIHNLKAY